RVRVRRQRRDHAHRPGRRHRPDLPRRRRRRGVVGASPGPAVPAPPRRVSAAPPRRMSYLDLTETEQHYWDEYGTLRAITDWEGYTTAQDNRKLAARDWLGDHRKEIWRCAAGKKNCSGGAGWDVNNRAARYDQLKDDSLNTATAKH